MIQISTNSWTDGQTEEWMEREKKIMYIMYTLPAIHRPSFMYLVLFF